MNYPDWLLGIAQGLVGGVLVLGGDALRRRWAKTDEKRARVAPFRHEDLTN